MVDFASPLPRTNFIRKVMSVWVYECNLFKGIIVSE